MAWYKTGTVSVTNGSTAVTGSGTDFITNAQVGDLFYIEGGSLYEISAIPSATTLTLADNYDGSTNATASYMIVPTQGLTRDLASAVAELISSFTSVRDGAGAGKFADGTAATPGIMFEQDQDTGFYRVGANNMALALAGAKQIDFNSNWSVDATGNISAVGGTFTGNISAVGGTFSGDISCAAIAPSKAVTSTYALGAAFSATAAGTGFANSDGANVVSWRSIGTLSFVFRGDSAGDYDTTFDNTGAGGHNVNVGGKFYVNSGSDGILGHIRRVGAANNLGVFFSANEAGQYAALDFSGSTTAGMQGYIALGGGTMILLQDTPDIVSMTAKTTIGTASDYGSATCYINNGISFGNTNLVLEDLDGGAGTHTQVEFITSSGGAGSINTNGTTTSYNTSSDPRLKTTFQNITTTFDASGWSGACSLIAQAVASKGIGVFDWVDGSATDVWGYNAHWLIDNQPGFGGTEGQGPRNMQLGEVYEPAEYDVMTDDDDNPILDKDGVPFLEEIEPAKIVTPAGVDQAKRVPLLEAAIYELMKEITDLKERVATLESA